MEKEGRFFKEENLLKWITRVLKNYDGWSHGSGGVLDKTVNVFKCM